jgi:hypothetical protein
VPGQQGHVDGEPDGGQRLGQGPQVVKANTRTKTAPTKGTKAISTHHPEKPALVTILTAATTPITKKAR